jgi:hypothetical protein
MEFTNKLVREKLKQINMLNPLNELEISFSQFKNRATVHKFGEGNTLRKIVFCGQPKDVLFGFYVETNTDINVLTEAYYLYKRLAKGDTGPIDEGYVKIGNGNFPLTYTAIRWKDR